MMFNPSMSQENEFEKIIREYLAINQQTENAFMASVQLAESAFLNQWKHLNQQRVHNQNMNWSNFIHQLQQINMIQSAPNNMRHHAEREQLSAAHKNNNDSVKSMKANSKQSETKSKLKSCKTKIEQYECKIAGCKKKYTTKGNLNRHLKDYHRLNSDLSPMPKDEATRNKKKSQTKAQFYCIHGECGEDLNGFRTMHNIKEHALHIHKMTDDELPQYLAQCKQAALRRNITDESLSAIAAPNAFNKQAHKRGSVVNDNAFITGADNASNKVMQVKNPFCIQTPAQIANQNANAPAPPLPTFILNNNHMPMINFAANNNPNKLSPFVMFNANNHMNSNNAQALPVPMPMVQILANNAAAAGAANNTLNTALMQISSINNNNKVNGMKSLITEILKKNQQQNKQSHNNNKNNAVFRTNLLNNIQINTTLNALQRIQKMPNVAIANVNHVNHANNIPHNKIHNVHNANINVKNVVKHEDAQQTQNKAKYVGLDILLKAADALDKNKAKDQENNKENGDAADHNKKVSKKRKINDTECKAPNALKAKRRKLCDDDPRIEKDSASGICSLCKKTKKTTSNYHWINHLQTAHRFLCDKCDGAFTKQCYLNDHVQNAHDK